MAKRKVWSQSVNLTLEHLKLGIALIYLHASGVPHIVKKFSMKAIIFFDNSPQLKIFTESYRPPK
jgi:hypothetical protein